MAQNFRGRFHTVQALQADVHQNHIGIQFPRHLHGVGPIVGLTHHLKVPVRPQNGLDSVTEYFVVVDE
jgi:hypothetical protein